MRRLVLAVAGASLVGLIVLGVARTSIRRSPVGEPANDSAMSPSGALKRKVPVIEPTITASDERVKQESFTVERVPFMDAKPDGFAPAGQIFKFGPSGQTFPAPVTITVPYDPRLRPKGAQLALYTRSENDTRWSKVDGATVDEERHVIVARVQHFSLFSSGMDCNSDPDGDGYTVCNGDCDESNPAIHAGVQEVCGNHVDDNCNGIQDEGCPSAWGL